MDTHHQSKKRGEKKSDRLSSTVSIAVDTKTLGTLRKAMSAQSDCAAAWATAVDAR